jgi:phage baseplate assembly protein W
MAVEVQLQRNKIYRDLDLSSCFLYNTLIDGKTISAELPIIDDVKAILRSLTNIFTYEPGDLYFGDQDISANVRRYLFEPMDFVTEISIKNDIKYSIEVYEPRIRVEDVIVNMGSDDAGTDTRNKMTVTLVFTINTLNKTITTSFDIERIR